MADLRYIKENTINKKLQSASASSCGGDCFFPFAIAFLMIGVGAESGFLIVFGLILFFLYFLAKKFGASNNKEIATLRSGLEGELKVQQILSRLSNDFTIFNQFEIPASNEYGLVETDFLVVGSNGIFLVEVKNNKGEIQIDSNENFWNVTKTGRGGTSYTSAPVRNPIKQVKSHIFALSQIFKANKIRIWIEGCVYFSGECELIGASQVIDVPLFNEANDLINYIANHRSKLTISKAEIISFLVNLSTRNNNTPSPPPPPGVIPNCQPVENSHSLKIEPVSKVQVRQKETFSPKCHDSEPDNSSVEKMNRSDVCRFCGENTSHSFRFCPHCGKQLIFPNTEQEDEDYLEINLVDLILDSDSLTGKKIKTQAGGFYRGGCLTIKTDNGSEYVPVEVENIPREEKKGLMTSSYGAIFVVWGKLTKYHYDKLLIVAQKVKILHKGDDY